MQHRTRRFFSPKSIVGIDEMQLSAAAARHASRVLRLRKGDEICVFDEWGNEREARIADIDKQNVRITLGDEVTGVVESPLDLSLAVAMIRGERMDFIIQKTTELGVKRISPLITERGVVRLRKEKSAQRMQHWQGVAQAACEQCGRRMPPSIDAPISMSVYLDSEIAGCKLLLDPRAGRKSHSMTRDPDTSMVLLIGPEGGFSEQEIQLAHAAGFQNVSLGPRILRTETAAIAGIALLQALAGDASGITLESQSRCE